MKKKLFFLQRFKPKTWRCSILSTQFIFGWQMMVVPAECRNYNMHPSGWRTRFITDWFFQVYQSFSSLPHYKVIAVRGGTNTGPYPNTSGNRCANPDPRCQTRLSDKVLISRITVYFILTVLFSFCEHSSHDARALKTAAWSINWLQLGIFPLTKLKILRSLSKDSYKSREPELLSFHRAANLVTKIKRISLAGLALKYCNCIIRGICNCVSE